jgi:hypothetical protein
MPANETHHSFAFVVDGIPLSDDQKAHVAKAVAQAGLNALASFNLTTRYAALPFLPLYRGIPAVSIEKYAELKKVAQQIESQFGG